MRIARFAAVAACLLALLSGLTPAFAGKRVALVIGNSAYTAAVRLSNPGNDASMIANMLRSGGFDEVRLHEDLGIRGLRQAIADFADAVRGADTAVVYYSGHGIEVNGANYLVPVDAALQHDIDVPFETFSLDNLVQVLEPARQLRLIILDACRDNPFAQGMKRTIGTRAISRGLAAVEPDTANTLIGYAAKAGSYALDGDGRNSPYAVALVKNLAIPGLDLRIAFGRVRDEVLRVTHNRQEPFVYGSLGGGIVSIVEAAESEAQPLPASLTPADHTGQIWATTQNSTSIAVLQSFVDRYGDSPYGPMARARIDELKKAKLEVAPSKPARRDTAGGCGPIIGTWLWYNGVRVTVKPNNTTVQSDGKTATVVCSDGKYAFTWYRFATTRMTLSADGKRMTGRGVLGPTFAVRQAD